jgi:hypothetical protein
VRRGRRIGVAGKVGVAPSAVKNVIIWGNHSTTQYADARMAMVARHARGHDSVSVGSMLGAGDAGREWMRGGEMKVKIAFSERFAWLE